MPTATSPRKNVTAKVLAESLQLPASTVGNILRGDQRYALKTRRRVHDYAKKCGYQPDPLARGLKGGKTHTIGVLWAISVPQVSARFTRQVARQAYSASYQTLITDTMSDPDVLLHGIEQHLLRRVCGAILQWPAHLDPTPKLVDAVRALPAAVVITDRQIEGLEADQIRRDTVTAFLDALKHIKAVGRTHTALIVPDRSSQSKSGDYLAAAAEVGLAAQVVAVPHDSTPFQPPAGDFPNLAADAVERRLSVGERIDALFCGSDEIALAVSVRLSSMGLRVPEDIAVIGFNNSDFANFVIPKLASISRESEALADLAMSMLMARIDDPNRPLEHRVLHQSFVLRESAGLVPRQKMISS